MDFHAHTLHVVDDLIQATFGDAEEFPQCLGKGDGLNLTQMLTDMQLHMDTQVGIL